MFQDFRAALQAQINHIFLLAWARTLRYFPRVIIPVRPEVILTHESDLDGFVSGLLLQRLARKIFNADIRIESYHYNNWKLRELREKSGWVCDFSFEPRLDKPDWLLIDHHATEVQP